MRGKGGPENAACTYKGVRQRTWGKWVAEIREPNHGSRVWVGTFDTSYDAAVAYDAVARRLYGADAKLNLPHLYEEKPQPEKRELFGGLLRSLEVNLPEVDDSYMWAEATKGTALRIVEEEGCFAANFDGNGVPLPWFP